MQKHSIEFYKKQAKQLKRQFSDGEVAAVSRVQHIFQDHSSLSLSEAQLVVARENGLQSWSKFKTYVESHLISGVQFRFKGKLKTFLKKKSRKNTILEYEDHRSLKDMIESLNIPHTEIFKIICDGKKMGFSDRGENGQIYDVYGFSTGFDPRKESIHNSPLLSEIRFLADINCGKLVRYLRIMGLNCIFEEPWDDRILAEKAAANNAIMLSRDAGLLRRNCIKHGLYLYSDNPVEQAAEVMNRFNIADQIKMMSRCVTCNSPTEKVTKAEVDHLLEPGTRQNYHEFWRCMSCAKVYWRGAHFKNLVKLVKQIEEMS